MQLLLEVRWHLEMAISPSSNGRKVVFGRRASFQVRQKVPDVPTHSCQPRKIVAWTGLAYHLFVGKSLLETTELSVDDLEKLHDLETSQLRPSRKPPQ